MSVDLNVYLRRADFPPPDALRELLRHAGDRIVVDPEIDLRTAVGWVGVTLDGVATGFEAYPRAIDDDRRASYRARLARRALPPDAHLEMLETCDFDLNLCCHDTREELAARLVLTAIAEAARGWLSDPQVGSMTTRLGV